MATAAAHFLIGYRSAATGESAKKPPRCGKNDACDQRHLNAGNRDDVEDVPAPRMRSLASLESGRAFPSPMAAAIAPSSPPMIALTLKAPDGCAPDRWQRRSAGAQLASPGGGRRWIGLEAVEPTAPTPAKNASRAKIVSARQAPRAPGGSRPRLELHIVAGRDVGVLRVVTLTRRGIFSAACRRR